MHPVLGRPRSPARAGRCPRFDGAAGPRRSLRRGRHRPRVCRCDPGAVGPWATSVSCSPTPIPTHRRGRQPRSCSPRRCGPCSRPSAGRVVEHRCHRSLRSGPSSHRTQGRDRATLLGDGRRCTGDGQGQSGPRGSALSDAPRASPHGPWHLLELPTIHQESHTSQNREQVQRRSRRRRWIRRAESAVGSDRSQRQRPPQRRAAAGEAVSEGRRRCATRRDPAEASRRFTRKGSRRRPGRGAPGSARAAARRHPPHPRDRVRRRSRPGADPRRDHRSGR